MSRSRRGFTQHHVPWSVVQGTSVAYDGTSYAISDKGGGVEVIASTGQRIEIGSCATRHEDVLAVKMTPGCESYLEARAYHRNPFDGPDVVAATVVAAVAGHPDAVEARLGTELSAVWSHHLAIVGHDDPDWVATTYAPTETKSISARILHMAALGVEVIRTPGS